MFFPPTRKYALFPKKIQKRAWERGGLGANLHLFFNKKIKQVEGVYGVRFRPDVDGFKKDGSPTNQPEWKHLTLQARVDRTKIANSAFYLVFPRFGAFFGGFPYFTAFYRVFLHF